MPILLSSYVLELICYRRFAILFYVSPALGNLGWLGVVIQAFPRYLNNFVCMSLFIVDVLSNFINKALVQTYVLQKFVR